MNNLTLKQLVRNQIAYEFPISEKNPLREEYITREINWMTSSELLERISNALVELQKPYDRSLWL